MSASPDVLVGSFAVENRSVFRARLTLHRPHVGNGQKAPIQMLLPNAFPEALQESLLGWHRTRNRHRASAMTYYKSNRTVGERHRVVSRADQEGHKTALNDQDATCQFYMGHSKIQRAKRRKTLDFVIIFNLML